MIVGPLFTATNTLERFDASDHGSTPPDLPTRLYRRFREQSIAKKEIAKAKSGTEIQATISSTPPKRSTTYHKVPSSTFRNSQF
mmetsp:Transcript_9757/g.24301  ORF Transcript_9757/g.24301 Transcript_9757/m.24301 type:complete len:84 (+) Transcript_9757:195-446(+)